ncbi:MAG TPA: two-component regulator propeller domain-containing protein, partial [Cyclobacteriaceae bacterium]|nr:two-component regulator propeller domain-containing protein [Cyclobacteriaceae bacterium]
MYRIFVVVVFALAPVCVFAQGNFVLHNYTAVHGVPQSQMNGMMEDNNGYLWLATYGGGVARFDGQNFKIYTTLDGLLNNTVYDLKIDSEQNIWAVHPQGVSRFNGTSFKTFQPVADSVNRNMVKRAVVFADTVLLLSAPGVLGKIYKDSVYYWNKHYQANAFIHRIFQFASGELCILMSDKRIFIKSAKGDVLVGSLPPDHLVYSGYRENNNLKLQSYSLTDNSLMVHEINPGSHSVQSVKTDSDNIILLSDPARHELWMLDNHNDLIKVNTLTNTH